MERTTFYFLAGRFSPTNMGFTYNEKDIFLFAIKGYDYNVAFDEAEVICKAFYGEQKTKNMWYGLVAHNWKLTQIHKHVYDYMFSKLNEKDCKIDHQFFKFKTSEPDPPIEQIIHKDPNNYPVSETQTINDFFN